MAAITSPSVRTYEVDLSQLPQAIAAIGAGMVGTCKSGPSFDPTWTPNIEQWSSIFGGFVPSCVLPYAAAIYHKNSDSLTTCRVLCPPSDSMTEVSAGWRADVVYAITGASGEYLALLYVSGAATMTDWSAPLGTSEDHFAFQITPADGVPFTRTGSWQSGSVDYLTKVWNTDPKQYFNISQSYWIDTVYQYAALEGGYDALFSGSGTEPGFIDITSTFVNQEHAYSSGSTPWVLSQIFGVPATGSMSDVADYLEYKLFRLHTRAHGDYTRNNVKTEVRNIKTSTNPDKYDFGTFDLIVRKYSDTDKAPVALETHANLTLDPTSKNYILRRIGNRYNKYDTTLKRLRTYGEYENKSAYVWIEMYEQVEFPDTAVPWGFEGFTKLSGMIDIPYVAYQKDNNQNASDRICWGLQFNSSSIVERFKPIPVGGTATTDYNFSLCHVTAQSGSTTDNLLYYAPYSGAYPTNAALSYVTATDATALGYQNAKFCFGFYGGVDGWAPWWADPINPDLIDATSGFGFGINEDKVSHWALSGQANKSGSYQARYALKQATDIFSLDDQFDINLFVIPGIYSTQIMPYAIDMCEERSDALCIVDTSGSTVQQAADWSSARQYDSSYAAMYYPDLYIDDPDNNVRKRVKPSVVIPGDAIAYTDRYSFAWYAPAGLTRGGLSSVVGITEKLAAEDRDKLHNYRINSIASFPRHGINVWDQLTTQVAETALNRINVRRMLLHVKKAIASAAMFLVFEPNVQTNWTKFRNIVDPILRSVLLNYGINDYRIIVENEADASLADRNELRGKIVLDPVRSIDRISIGFIITNSVTQFIEG